MKIRQGFVSNSSSSSFIVGLPATPGEMTTEEIREYFFGDRAVVGAYDYHITTKDAAHRIHKDLLHAGLPLKEKDIIEEMVGGSFTGEPPYNWPPSDASQKVWDDWTNNQDKLCRAAAKKIVKCFLRQYPGLKFYSIEYSDNGDGPMGISLEHGDFWVDVPHIQVSKH